MSKRDSLADLERKLQGLERLGLKQSARRVRERIAALKAAGERLKAYRFKTAGGLIKNV